jgi:type I restriction enzyme S subunit
LRRVREKARDLLETTFQSFLNRAFSGNLTAKWREVHMKELLAEMEEQAKIIGVSTDVEYEQLSLL